MTDFTITTALQVPREAAPFGIPIAWAHDGTVSFYARGLLAHILSHAESGVEVTADMVGPFPSDADLLAELVRAGYLVPGGEGRYELVHPDRLPPLPA
jgi:hypothetical protein